MPTNTAIWRTVCGSQLATDLTSVLAAETLVISPVRVPGNRGQAATAAAFEREPVSIGALGRLMMGGRNRDDATLAAADAYAELTALASVWGGAVEAAPAAQAAPTGAVVALEPLAAAGYERAPQAADHGATLRELSKETGVTLLRGTNGGWAADVSIADAVSRITDALNDPAGPAGVIGALPIPSTNEAAVFLEQAARLAAETGVSLVLDGETALTPTPDGWDARVRSALDIIDRAGLGRDRVVIAGITSLIAERHTSGRFGVGIDPERLGRVTALGTALCFDGLGRIPNVTTVVSDHDIAVAIMGLAADGHADRLLLSCGITQKHRLTAFGGNGLGFITQQYAPYLGMFGADAALLTAVTGGNAARIFALTAAEEAQA
ncbi:hypothetical protein ICM05_01835 [Leucobacter sp. cx-42]|uniref:hypothetical protein n=1 Tax=unclassified Leucobacter TaxID=2621730 RepID=UPI00165E2BF3|nr:MULTISPECIES: hypothetical protein [unclassified Leucobacter]MBC9953388.1 hypothetical protein [Leucobacter sp. cx-42]